MIGKLIGYKKRDHLEFFIKICIESNGVSQIQTQTRTQLVVSRKNGVGGGGLWRLKLPPSLRFSGSTLYLLG